MDREEMLETIEGRLSHRDLSPFQVDFLSSIQRQLLAGKTLSESQLSLLDKVLVQTEPGNLEVWELSEEEKHDIEVILKLSAGYSSYYLSNYKIALKNALEHLHTVMAHSATGQRVLSYERKYYSTAMSHLKSKMLKLKNPKVKQGDLCFYRDTVCVVITPAAVNSKGAIVCTVDLGGQQFEVDIDSLRKRTTKR